MPISRGFRGLRRDEPAGRRLPPGQYLERGFPVLTAGPAPRIALDQWTFTVGAPGSPARIWTFNKFIGLGAETVTCDIHCVTRWSKFDTTWQGVSVDTLLALAYGQEPPDAGFAVAYAEGGYTTNLPLADVVGGRAWVVHTLEGRPLAPEHGGPARLLVPHLYLWKSAKWVRGLRLLAEDDRGFWESLGYHNRGDPWLEQRYSDD